MRCRRGFEKMPAAVGVTDSVTSKPPLGWIWTGVPFAVQVSVSDAIEQDTLPVTWFALTTVGAPNVEIAAVIKVIAEDRSCPSCNNAVDVDGALPT